MKTGKSLIDLATEIERQHETKRDFRAPTKLLTMTIADDKPMLNVGDKFSGAINEIAHDQIGTFLKIPAPYYDRMRKDEPQLLAINVNAWMKKTEDQRLVRTLDERTRAFMSNTFRPLDNTDLANATLPIIRDRGLDLMSCEITEKKLYIKAVDPRIHRDVPTGRKLGDGSHVFFDTCSPAIIISNSEVGYGALSVESGIYTKVCTNLAMIAGAGMKRRHVGARHALSDEVEAIAHMLSEKTKAATDRAIWLQVQDIVKHALDETAFGSHCTKLAEIAGNRIERDVPDVIEVVSERYGFTETEGKSVLRHLIEGGDLTQYGLHSAVTRASADFESYDRASEFEAIGGKIIELPKTEWERIAVAA